MRQRLLGRRTGLRVSELALGCGRLGATVDATNPAAAHATLAAFADAGGTLIDTSSAHQDGRSEEIVGRFLSDAGRERFVISTKYGRSPRGDQHSLTGGAHPRAMLAQVEASLRRLGTDRIDLYSLEFPDGVTPLEEVVRGMDVLLRQGKVVAFGLSNFAAWEVAQAATLAELRGWAPLSAIHHQYNLLVRDVEREHVSMADAFGLGLLAWSPQAGGRLARTPLDVAPDLAGVLHAAAAAHGVGVNAIAVAWLLVKGVIPVLGARTAGQLADPLRASDLVLTAGEVAQLDAATSPASPADWLGPLRAAVGITPQMLAATRRGPSSG